MLGDHLCTTLIDTNRARHLFALECAGNLDVVSQLFDLVLMCDGLHSWRLTHEEQARSLDEAHRILVPGGYAVFTEHLNPRDFQPLIGRIQASPLEMVSVRYLHNRLWYSMERSLRRFRGMRSVQAVLASRGVARGLMAVASLAGPKGAKHLCVIAQKAPSAKKA